MGVNANNFQYANDDKPYVDGQIALHNASGEAHPALLEQIAACLIALKNTVTAVPGMGLSKNNYSDEEKEKVLAAASGVERLSVLFNSLSKELGETVKQAPGMGLSENNFTALDKQNLQEAHRMAGDNRTLLEAHIENDGDADKEYVGSQIALHDANGEAHPALLEQIEDCLNTLNGMVGRVGEGENSVVFNDYENNRALSAFSMASGSGTIAGIKGYYYSAIDFSGNNPVITLTKKQGAAPTESFTVGYAVGDVISLVNGSKYPNCATITEINKNVITVDSLPFSSVTWDNGLDDNSFYVINKPSIGFCNLGSYAHAEGDRSQALEWASHAEGRQVLAFGQYGHAEGRATEASYAAHAEGYKTKALKNYSHAEGQETEALAIASHAEGQWTNAEGDASHAEGQGSLTYDRASHAEGISTKASAEAAHAEGQGTKALAIASHAEGYSTEACGTASHAEGLSTKAKSDYSHAEGRETEASSEAAHAEGDGTRALGYGAHAEGVQTKASAHAHAEGNGTKATGTASHAEGYYTEAIGRYSHAEGFRTIATVDDQHVRGRYNAIGNYADIVGNGTSEEDRRNAYTLDWDGNAWFAGKITVGENNEEIVTDAALNLKLGDIETALDSIIAMQEELTGGAA